MNLTEYQPHSPPRRRMDARYPLPSILVPMLTEEP
jgi:hypothetical protein